MFVITDIQAREILDSRGTPTVEADIVLSNGVVARASVPSGASTGSKEALELRDGDESRYLKKGVLKAVSHVNGEIRDHLLGKAFASSAEIDQVLIELDGTADKSRLGANAILAVSIAVARAMAISHDLPLYRYVGGNIKQYKMPVPMMNIVNGGAHASNNLDFQEFMIIPVSAPTFKESIRYGSEIFHTLKKILHSKGLSTTVGDEGGFAPDFQSHSQALEVILQAIEEAGFVPGRDIMLALDCAASEFYKNGDYILEAEGLKLNSEQMVNYLTVLADKYPIISIEDGLHEQDFTGWELLQETLGKNLQIVGDDIFVTNPAIVKKGIKEKLANAVLIKPNQIGTLLEVAQTIEMAKNSNWNTIMSHRSGETEDAVIADLAVGWNCGQIKTGSLSRSDRIAKYNQLMRIEQELGKSAIYLGVENLLL
jgi:enolase